MKTNAAVKRAPVYTAEGGRASHITAEQELRRTVMSCLLWESEFYENGQSIADRIKQLVPKCRTAFVAACAVHARHDMKLRHVPLLLVREMARYEGHKAVVGRLLPDVISRADELSEFLSIYWLDDKNQPLSKQVKLGLAAAFTKFDAFQLAKYDRDGAVKLRDVAFLTHVQPWDGLDKRPTKKVRTYKHGSSVISQKTLLRHEASTLAQLVGGTLPTPDTWEVALSAGGDKKETFERLMAEKKLGALAFVRNLRGMLDAGVDENTLKMYSQTLGTGRVLPFQFVTAARMAPQLEPMLEPLMLKCLAEFPKLVGRTALLIDVSGSMDEKLSAKGETKRLDVASGLAILSRELIGDLHVFTFSNGLVQVPPRDGFALRDAITTSQPHGGTRLALSLNTLKAQSKVKFDRVIVITDEQSADGVVAATLSAPAAYIINVASNKRGVGYGQGWTHIDGWSEHVFSYISALESPQD